MPWRSLFDRGETGSLRCKLRAFSCLLSSIASSGVKTRRAGDGLPRGLGPRTKHVAGTAQTRGRHRGGKVVFAQFVWAWLNQG